VIIVEDDGNGIDPKKIYDKAVSKGIIKTGKEMSDKEILDLIFHPGFSTKEQVTEVSGRGVGMDVVKQNISILGGSISRDSVIGRGSKFKISLPLTMAVIEGLVIHADDEKFVLPLSQVDELVMFDEGKLESFSGTADLFRLRGETLNTFYLNKKLKKKDSKKAVLLVLRSLDKPIGVIIDEVSHKQQIVINKLEDDIKFTTGVMGAAILADGLPSIILDLAELYRRDIQLAG
jgi:two-component system chemotaxis sensor kinase CheA